MRTTYEVGFYAEGNGHEPSTDWQTLKEYKSEGAVTRFINRVIHDPQGAGLTCKAEDLGEAGLMIRVALEEPEPEPGFYQGGYTLIDVALLHYMDWLDRKCRKDTLEHLGAFYD